MVILMVRLWLYLWQQGYGNTHANIVHGEVVVFPGTGDVLDNIVCGALGVMVGAAGTSPYPGREGPWQAVQKDARVPLQHTDYILFKSFSPFETYLHFSKKSRTRSDSAYRNSLIFLLRRDQRQIIFLC